MRKSYSKTKFLSILRLNFFTYLKTQKLSCYWANTSSNSLVGKLIREGSPQIKESMEDLLNDKTLCMEIDEQIIFNQLDHHENAIWSLLLASGYLKANNYKTAEKSGKDIYELALTNKKVRIMFEKMIREWFGQSAGEQPWKLRESLRKKSGNMVLRLQGRRF